MPKVTQVASVGGVVCIQFYLVPKPMLLNHFTHINYITMLGAAHLKEKALNKQEAVAIQRNVMAQGAPLAPESPFLRIGHQGHRPW